MAQDKEDFLSRWSRLKQEDRQLPETKPQPAEAPLLPPLDKLTPESDFSVFMHPKVQDTLRRAALKKLFSDPHFNVPDPYEAYSGDWTGGEPISEEMLKTLNQARTHLFGEGEKQEKDPQVTDAPDIQAAQAPNAEAAGAPEEDEPRREDA